MNLRYDIKTMVLTTIDNDSALVDQPYAKLQIVLRIPGTTLYRQQYPTARTLGKVFILKNKNLE